MRKILLLATIWIILNGALTFLNLAWGIVVGAASLWLAVRFMKPGKIEDVRFFRLVFYPLFLLGEVYLNGFRVIKMIIMGCYTEVVTVETAIRNDFLTAMLCNSITMIPGSVVLTRDDPKITVMVLRKKTAPSLITDGADVSKEVMGKPESRLIKAQIGG
jgi:multicomponent Na+:H+ antiporter subunit E